MGRIRDLTKQERILSVLSENSKGVWLAELARRVKMFPASVNYIIFGQKKKEKFYGGYLKNKVKSYKLGRNKMIKLRVKENV